MIVAGPLPRLYFDPDASNRPDFVYELSDFRGLEGAVFDFAYTIIVGAERFPASSGRGRVIAGTLRAGTPRTPSDGHDTSARRPTKGGSTMFWSSREPRATACSV
jgi:hypothetical protein